MRRKALASAALLLVSACAAPAAAPPAIGQISITRDQGPPGQDIVRDFHTWNSGMPAGE